MGKSQNRALLIKAARMLGPVLDAQASISASYASIEELLREYIAQNKIAILEARPSFHSLWGSVRKHLTKGEDLPTGVLELLDGMNKAIVGCERIRNNASLAHHPKILPTAIQARLVLNATATLLSFVIEQWLEGNGQRETNDKRGRLQ